MEWWKELYSTEDYLTIFSPYITSEQTLTQIDFIISNLPLRQKDKILDLCCGTGRHSLELARRGYQVVAFDWSEEYLTIARKMAREENLAIEFVQGDMREIGFENQFEVVLNMFTSFGYFDEDEDNERVIQQVAQALKPGGLFFFDFINLEPLIRFSTPVMWHQDPQFGAVVIRERSLDLFKWRLCEKCTIFIGSAKREYSISYRLYTLAEFVNLLSRHGLKFRNAFGDFDGRDVYEDSPPRMIVVARKE